MSITTLPTILLQIFCKIIFIFKVIVKSVIDPDDNFTHVIHTRVPSGDCYKIPLWSTAQVRVPLGSPQTWQESMIRFFDESARFSSFDYAQQDVAWDIAVLNLSSVEATFVQSPRMPRFLKIIWTLPCWYSLDSSRWVLSDEYPCTRVLIIFQVFESFCIGQN